MIWYEEEIKRLENQRDQVVHQNEVLFYGSSSITQWKNLAQDFPNQNVVNLGFGGSTLAACVWFFERVMASHQPKSMIFYGGDNDLGDGRNPEEVFDFFLQLLAKVREQFGDLPFAFISIKPSIMRWNIVDNIKYTNHLVEKELLARGGNHHFVNIFDAMLGENGRPDPSLFEPDGLHLSPLGYQCWKEHLLQYPVPLL
jgi:lysophospholipase L1-like esterase